MNPCPAVEQLRRLLAEEVTQLERAPLEIHVEHCARCQQTLERLTADSLRGTSDPADTPVQPPLLELRGLAPRKGGTLIAGDAEHTTALRVPAADEEGRGRGTRDASCFSPLVPRPRRARGHNERRSGQLR